MREQSALDTVNRISSWVPAVAVTIQLLFAAATRLHLGRWPVQGEDLEFPFLGSTVVVGLGWLALVTAVTLLLSLVAWPASAAALRGRSTVLAKRGALFFAPIGLWWSLIFLTGFDVFVNWWWD